jgi:hypothetical protein
MIPDELKDPPTREQIRLWQETEGHTNHWLAGHLGMDEEDFRHRLEVGFTDEDLRVIAGLMKHPREILGE